MAFRARADLLLIMIFLASFAVLANECGKFCDNLTSPVCTDAKYIFWTGSLTTLGLYLSRHDTVDKWRLRASEKKPLQSWGSIGEAIGWGYLPAAYVLGALTYGWSASNKRSIQNAEHMMEASGYSMLMAWGLKELISTPRPDNSNERDSFPSGHATLAFAFASVVTANHAWYWGVLSHALAIFIASSRVSDDRHFTHDVVAGATIGMSFGWGIYLNHKKYRKPFWLAALPTDDMRGAQLAWSYNY